jgi:flagellar biosynthesis/type III secretory pathway protein FliH
MNLINDLIKCDEEAYQKGYEDGMRAALSVQKTIDELNKTEEQKC